MPAIKVTEGMFAGSGQLYGKKGLGAVLRGIAIDNARLKLGIVQIADLTDNTTGTAGSQVVDLKENPAVFNAGSSGGVTTAALTTSLGKIADAQKVLANSVNKARTRLGLPTVSAPDGTEAAADTLPALDKTGTAGSGASTPTASSVRAAFKVVKDNQRKLARAINEVLRATDNPAPKLGFTGSVKSDLTLDAKRALSASTNGSNSVSKTEVDAFLTKVANNYATLAAAWNAAMTQAAPSQPLSVVAG